nr:ribonuclease H-like domain-containing protein [Tanacetum cinerariifolium]
MDFLSLQVVSAAKLPILNPNEFDLWKMMIEQYFLLTDYSLWEVILNGDSPAPTRIVERVVQPNKNKDDLVDGKEHDDDIQKSVSPAIHSSSSGAQTRKQGDKTENKDKGKSHVVTITGFRDLNAEFEECTNNSSNGVNAASSSVSTAGHNFINNTNDFSAA